MFARHSVLATGICFAVLVASTACDRPLPYELVKCYHSDSKCVVEARFSENWLCDDFLKNGERSNNDSPLGTYKCRRR